MIQMCFYFLQGAFACDMILLYMMNTSSYYREKKFEIINFKYGQMCLLNNMIDFAFKK